MNEQNNFFIDLIAIKFELKVVTSVKLNINPIAFSRLILTDFLKESFLPCKNN